MKDSPHGEGICQKEGLGKFTLNSFMSAIVMVAEREPDYTPVFKDVFNRGIEMC